MRAWRQFLAEVRAGRKRIALVRETKPRFLRPALSAGRERQGRP